MATITATRTARLSRRPRPAAIRTYLKVMGGAHGPHSYVALLGMTTFDTQGLHEKVQQGLSFASFKKLTEAMQLPMRSAAELLLITSRTLHRRQESGRLEPDESDRLVRLSRLFGKAIELFEGDNDGAMQWLQSPARALGGASPLDMCKTEPGALEVEQLIGRLEHGVFS